jgi:short-subunit dehydrogenase
LQQAVASLPGKATALPMDVGSTESVTSAATELPRLDGIVFLAGVYTPMRAQDWDASAAEAMANVNFTGCVRVLGAVLPDMVARGQGHVVITGSLSGFRGLPGAIGYAASKAGTMVLAESLYADLRKTDIAVQLANPGFIRTRLTAKNDFAMPFIMEPEAAADIMFRHMQTVRFKISFPTLFSWLFRAGQFMPDWLYYRLFPPKP